MKIAVIAINPEGKKIYRRIKKSLPEARLVTLTAGERLSDLIPDIFDRNKYEGLIFVMALGIVVRVIAPYIKNKYQDPAVVAIDDCGNFVISALSGHEGGANALTKKIASVLNAQAVITTASYNKKLSAISCQLSAKEKKHSFFSRKPKAESRKLIIGIGCRKGAKKEAILKAIKTILKKNKKSLQNVKCLATISLKAQEPGLKEAAHELGLTLKIIPISAIKNFAGNYNKSTFVQKKIGVEGVCEPCALLAVGPERCFASHEAGETKLILKKQIINGITLAIAREN